MPKKENIQIMFLETHMDQKLASSRTQMPFMCEFFRNLPDVGIIPMKVHSRQDMEKFLGMARENKDIKAVHIVAHGERTSEESAIVLTGNEYLDLKLSSNQSLFEGLKKEVIFLSCCQLGRDSRLMRNILKIAEVDSIFSYRRNVNDYQAFITESLFYHLAYGIFGGRESYLNVSWGKVYNRLVLVSYLLGIDKDEDERYAMTSPLLAAEFRRVRD